jgi:hypothetical protein
MFDESVKRLAREIGKASGKSDEPRYIPTRFDKALDYGDGPILRWALSKYVEDQVLTVMRGTNPDALKIDNGNESAGRPPFNTTQQKALSRIAFVHKHLGLEDRRDLLSFLQMMAPLNSEQATMSMAEFARQKTGISDDKVREGCFIGLMWKVAQRLYDIYRLRELPQQLALEMAA